VERFLLRRSQNLELSFLLHFSPYHLTQLHPQLEICEGLEEASQVRNYSGRQLLLILAISPLLGVWISEDMSWSRNTTEICRKAYSRLGMLTKLKYVGVSTEDLLNIYILFIRSCAAEYCSVVYHSRLTVDHITSLERIQKTCLKIILSESYVSYEAALEMTGLQTLSSRREKRCLDFSLNCVNHERNSRLFPLNTLYSELHNVRQSETFLVNFANTETYRTSAIPYCQRMLNKHFKND
jgi:hypothetical protein